MSARSFYENATIARTLFLLFLIIISLSMLFLLGVTRYLKHESISQLAMVEARQQSELIFQSIYSVMRKGWDREEIDQMMLRLNKAMPDIEVAVVRSGKVAELFGETPGSKEARQDLEMQKVMQSGEEALLQVDDTLRFLFPMMAHKECLSCHGNVSEGDVNGVIDIHFPATRLKVPLEFTLHTTLITVGMMFLLLFLLLFLGVRTTLARPIVMLSEHMADIRKSDKPNRRLEMKTSWLHEIKDLTDNFNDLMSRLDEAQEQLLIQSERDPLTQLYNRRKFDELFDRELVRSKRYDHEFVILMLDLNKFKPINDSLGHAAGDAMLVALAESFQEQMRENDVVARVGGDEFAVLLPETPASQAREMASKVVQIVSDTKTEYAGQPLQVGTSVGAVCYPRDGDDAKSLLIAADMAMYADKASKRASGEAPR
ncbi:MAG: diguanylate cyclase [Magnetococcales bacterium]|nr:diguanylate cyclase [Magnetococcales bacterium]